MAITGAGFDGTLTEADWARIAGPDGIPDQTVPGASTTDYAVTLSTTALSATVAPGTYNRHGILAKSTATETVTFTNPASGSRWDCVALLLDWTTNTVSLVVIQGTTSQAVPWASMQKTIGTKAHVPLALVKLTAGMAAPAGFQDLRLGANPASPYAVAVGGGAVVFSGQPWISQAVPLPPGRFSQPPVVMVALNQSGGAAKFTLSVDTETTSSFNIVASSADGSNANGQLLFTWMAVQMTPTSRVG